jgi:hypothetical protein
MRRANREVWLTLVGRMLPPMTNIFEALRADTGRLTTVSRRTRRLWSPNTLIDTGGDLLNAPYPADAAASDVQWHSSTTATTPASWATGSCGQACRAGTACRPNIARARSVAKGGPTVDSLVRCAGG